MNAMNKWMLAGAIASTALATNAHARVIDNVTPVTVIDPLLEADDTTYENANWNKSGNPGWVVAAGVTNTFVVKNKAGMTALAGVQVLNFESAQGFGTATRRLGSNGTIFSPSGSITPYLLSEAVTAITTTAGSTVNLAYTTFGNRLTTPAAYDSGVFLIADRAEASYPGSGDYKTTNTYTMTSGSQGLVAGPSGGGVLFTFDTNLYAFSANFNLYGSSGSPTYVVSYYDEQGNLLGTYTQGIGNSVAAEFGLYSSAGNIRSVWVGQSTTNNGLIIDDVAFVPVPEPATAGIVLGGGLGVLALLRKK